MILTKSYLKNESLKVPNQKKILYESVSFDKNKTYDVFISHSYLDKDLIEVLYKMFSDCGYNVFIDWKNESLQNRECISRETANKLKNYMNNSTGLLYISTQNSSNSKWCPWELGYVDGKKERVAIFPILDDDNKGFKGQEYLGIYPYIEYEKVSGKMNYEFWVVDPNNPKLYSTLKEWLKTGILGKHN